MGRTKAVVELLKEYGRLHGGSEWGHLDRATLSLIRSNLFAFLIALAFDQGMPWQMAWPIPAEIDRKGFLEPKRLASMSEGEGIERMGSLPIRPRWGVQEGAKTLPDAAHLVCEQFDGDTGAI